MKEFNGSVVIIDPTKFAKAEDLGSKIDIKLSRISPKLEFHGLFIAPLGVSQMFVYQYRVDNAKEYYSIGTEKWVKETINKAFQGQLPKTKVVSQSSIDSGSIGVFLKSDIDSYNPGILETLKEGEDYILLENYRGKIGYLRDSYGVIHFYGTGNTNFYTL